jgi:hypothetical protein
MSKRRALAKRGMVYLLSLLLIAGSFSGFGYAQVSTTSRISVTVMDPQGAVVPEASIVIKNDATGTEFKSNTGSDGLANVASLPIGTYTVTVTAKGFKTTVVTNVKTEVGAPSSVPVTLEVGTTNETVTVTGGAEALQKESTTIGSTITGRQITQLPFTSRDALDLVLNLPGTQTGGRPRTSTVNGLPKAALNINFDGINVQDGLLRSSDGFFTFVRPRVDAIEEVRVQTAGQTAESAAGGAVQISFVTKGGTNEYHGGAWWYNRQRGFNSNYYFNKLNRITLADGSKVETPRAQVMLNQWGVKVGGPVLKDKVFFFVSYDSYHLPEQTVRTRTILTPAAQNGIFSFPDAAAPGGVRSVNLYSLAGAAAASANLPTTPDPTIAKILADIRSSTSAGALNVTSDPNLQSLTFTNQGGQTRRFPDIRLDINLTSKHHIEAIYHFNDFAGQADFLNNADPAFPNPVPQILGKQESNRFSFSTALRSQLSSSLVNEARYGLVGGTTTFFANLAPDAFAPFGGVSMTFPLVTSPQSVTAPSRRNAPRFEFRDTLSYVRGKHNLSGGVSWAKNELFSQAGGIVPGLTFGLSAATDPGLSAFNSIPSSFQANARALYALLTGRLTAINFNAKLDENTKTYSLNSFAITRNQQYEYGLFGQDAWRVRDNLTLNYGLRWEAVLAPRNVNAVYVRPGYEGLFGKSGVGNLFKPGAASGVVPAYTPVDKDTKPYADDKNNYAPNFGVAWTPRFENSWLKKIFGDGDKTVLRAGYSISFFTGGSNEFDNLWGSNPGLQVFAGQRAELEFPAGSKLLRNGLPTLTAPAAFTYPRNVVSGIGAINDYDPNLRSPYVQSYSFGIQREINKDTVFEARYVGNRSIALVRQYNLNEVNIFENGFLQEFIAAQNNLKIARAANATASNFRNAGLAGQVALPIFEASFGSATSTQFANSTFITQLERGLAGAAANTLAFTTAFQTNRNAKGLAPNLFIINPEVFGGGSFLLTNGGTSNYNALQVELRRRLSNGLLVQASYTFSKSLTDQYASASNAFVQPTTLRDNHIDYGPSPFDIRHGFKANYVWELPIGPGRKFLSGGGIVGKLLEGWESDGVIRWQSGRSFNLTCGRATVNQFEAGCNLVGIDVQGFQDLIKIRKAGDDANRGTVYWLPRDFVDNTLKAFQLVSGTPTGPHIAPPNTPGKLGSLFKFYGPSFIRSDLSVVKKTRITEKTNLELRAEFLNAFNNTNFLIGSAANDVTGQGIGLTFGQTNSAYQDTSTTNDPGGRLIQFVIRINF